MLKAPLTRYERAPDERIKRPNKRAIKVRQGPL